MIIFDVMKTQLAILAIAVASSFSTGSVALADCRCVANGVRFSHGQLACLNLPTGSRMARCEKVLNNSSWTVLNENCQHIVQSEQQGDVAMLADIPLADDGQHRPDQQH